MSRCLHTAVAIDGVLNQLYHNSCTDENQVNIYINNNYKTDTAYDIQPDFSKTSKYTCNCLKYGRCFMVATK